MMDWPPRRVVTGHDEAGKSVVVVDGAPAVVETIAAGNARMAEIWTSRATPVRLAATEPDPIERPVVVPPPANGHVIRYFEFDPGWCSPMHRTESLDYGIVLRGEVAMRLDDSEVVLGPGDVVIQRGTDHAWENRGDGAGADALRARRRKLHGRAARRARRQDRHLMVEPAAE